MLEDARGLRGLLIGALASGLLVASCAAQDRGAGARPPAAAAPPQLRNLAPAEAEQLLGKVRDAQEGLRRGEGLTFQLLSGAPAAFPMADVSPRQAFLSLSFGHPFSIEKVLPEEPLWRRHKVVVLPSGPGEMMWEVEVVLGFYGQLERVEMLYQPPHPF